MSWKKYFTPVAVGKDPGSYSPVGSHNGSNSRPGPASANYSSFLPDVYTGAPNRIERYLQYSTMDMDSEVAAALDILAEFCTQKNKENKTPFYLSFRNKATNSEISILREYLQQWSKLQQFDTRMFRIIRNVFKNGDCFFIRDPETQKWNYIDPAKIVKIIVNESDGKLPEQYVIRDLSPNFHDLVVTAINPGTTNTNNRGTSYVAGGAAARGMFGAYPANPSSSGSRFTMGQDEVAIESRHIVHLSLSEGLDNNYPFGNSILENIFKVYKQKELLEDAIIIYRITRAPERRVFYIDVGNMPSHLAMSFVERVKNEINQRRIPSPVGGAGSYAIDSAFNPMSTNEDFYFPTTSDGKGSKVDVLPGGANVGEIADLQFFTNKLFRGLRIPSSYLPTGAEDSGQQYNDGRVGTAYIQELRFNNYCMRLQSLVEGEFDQEFKLYLYNRGVNIDTSLFELKLQDPQNFASYRQAEMDNQRAPTFSQMINIPVISKRFALKRFLGLSDEDLAENERLWAEENGQSTSVDTDSVSEMRGIGISQAGIQSDASMAETPEMPAEGADIMGATSPEAAGQPMVGAESQGQ